MQKDQTVDPRIAQTEQRIRVLKQQWIQRNRSLERQNGAKHSPKTILVVGKWHDRRSAARIVQGFRSDHFKYGKLFLVSFDLPFEGISARCGLVVREEFGVGGGLTGLTVERKEYSPDSQRLGSFARLGINFRVLEDIKPDAVVAFPGDRADAHLALIAQASGTKVFWPFRKMWRF